MTVSAQEDEELYKLQMAQWLPLSEWLCSRYEVNVKPTKDISMPTISDDDRQKLRRHLLSYNLWAVFGESSTGLFIRLSHLLIHYSLVIRHCNVTYFFRVPVFDRGPEVSDPWTGMC